MSHTAIRRSLASTLAGAVIAAGAIAPVADADQDLRSPDARDAAAVVTLNQDLRSPDARDAAERATAEQDLRSPDTRDAAEGYRPVPDSEAAVGAASSASGLDWVSAAIGAAAGTGVLVLLLVLGGGRRTGLRAERTTTTM